MHTIKSLSWVFALSIVGGALVAVPANAQSFSDITGTNIWNNVAPVFETDSELDAELIENVTRLNQESAAAYTACNEAIAAAEQNPTTRRFARQPSTQTAAVPAACNQLETLRTEVESLRSRLTQAASSTANPALRAW